MNFIRDFMGKKIGVWGLGAVGKSAVAFFRGLGLPVEVMNDKALTQEQWSFLDQFNNSVPMDSTSSRPSPSAMADTAPLTASCLSVEALCEDWKPVEGFDRSQISFCTEKDVLNFLQCNDYILASPGIDLRPYKKFKEKWITELDIFGSLYKKPIIAITGSVGKTTVTTLLSQILSRHGLRILTGGNIGMPMLTLLSHNNESDMALLEISSFQLEHCKSFAPDLAIITNVYPNHLDRHDSFEQYKEIKFNITKCQNNNQKLLLPYSLNNIIPYKLAVSPYFFDYNVTSGIMRHRKKNKSFDLSKFPNITPVQNWMIICSILELLNIPLTAIDNALQTLKLPEHRLEKVATLNGIDFYNDSKSTTPEATLAAVEQLHNKPIILLLGGLSKGINREPLIKKLYNQVKMIICFGKEADSLSTLCAKYKIKSYALKDLKNSFETAKKIACNGDQILLSPAGSSFDLFKNYEVRGKFFKLLVKQQQKN